MNCKCEQGDNGHRIDWAARLAAYEGAEVTIIFDREYMTPPVLNGTFRGFDAEGVGQLHQDAQRTQMGEAPAGEVYFDGSKIVGFVIKSPLKTMGSPIQFPSH